MTIIRYLSLLLPILALAAAGLADRTKPGRAGALLAFTGVTVGVAAQHEIARLAGWWSFAPVDGAFRGLPVDLWIGWGILWGAVPVLLRRHVPVPVALAGLFWLDLIAMPRMEPLLTLGPQWIVGEMAGIALVALPAQLAGRWSADRLHLWPRMFLQMGIFTSMALWLVPQAAFELGDGSWATVAAHPRWVLFTAAQLALLLGAPAFLAAIEFARRGRGTPYPWDPPRTLVTTGPYAYVANPMQLGMVLLLLLLAWLSASWTLAAAGVSAAAFSWAVAAVHEREQLYARHGEQWVTYRQYVRDWIPRRRPHIAVPAVLFLDDGCGPCSRVQETLARHHPVGLTLASAAEHPQTLWRARYESADGHTENGVAAVTRALEHVNLFWANAGWLLRLPALSRLAQLLTDAYITSPHPASPRSHSPIPLAPPLRVARSAQPPAPRAPSASVPPSASHA